MTSIAENPAVTDPRKALTPAQRDALGAAKFFKHHNVEIGGWRIGNKRFTHNTIRALEEAKLVTVQRRGQQTIRLTMAGQLAVDKLQGKIQ